MEPTSTPDFEHLAKDYIETDWQELVAYASDLADTVGEEIINPNHIKEALTENITIEIYEAHRLEPADETPTEIWPESYYEPLEQAVAKQVETDLDLILVDAYEILKENSEEAWERHLEYNEMTLPKK